MWGPPTRPYCIAAPLLHVPKFKMKALLVHSRRQSSREFEISSGHTSVFACICLSGLPSLSPFDCRTRTERCSNSSRNSTVKLSETAVKQNWTWSGQAVAIASISNSASRGRRATSINDLVGIHLSSLFGNG